MNQKANNSIQIITHEIRNQLSPILSLSYMIKNNFYNDKNNYIEAIDDINECVQNTLKLVDDLNIIGDKNNLTYPYLNSIKKEQIFIRQLILAINNIKSIYEGDALIDVKNELSDKDVYNIIFIDLARTKQILLNIISNSIKYSLGKDKIINIKISKSKNYLHILIVDNGIGMSKNELRNALLGNGPLIIKRLKKDHQIISNGIGLPLSVSMLKQQDMKYRITSQKNLGTEFLIKIPIY